MWKRRTVRGRPVFSWMMLCQLQKDWVRLALKMEGFPDSSAGKESACSAGDLGSIPGLGRSPGEGKGYPLQYSRLENSMDCMVHGVAKSRIRLSDFHFHFHFEDRERGPLDSGSWEVPQFTANRQFTAVSSLHQNRDISPMCTRNWLLPTVWMRLNKISPKASRKERGVQHLDFSPGRRTLDFTPTKLKKINLCYL